MSMASMLGKMIVAGLVAKGVGKLAGGSGSGGGLGGALAGMLGGGGGSNSGGMLGGAAGSVLGGLLGGSSGGNNAPSLGSLLNSLGGGQQGGSQGGIGDILGSFMGDDQQTQQLQPTQEQNQQAEVLLKAILNAAKCDGQIDKDEQQKIIQHLGDVSAEEERFLKTELSAPLDTQGFIRSVPRGMEQQVYFVSLTTINLDSKPEAQYLHSLAQGLGISEDTCNQIHAQVGAPQLYR